MKIEDFKAGDRIYIKQYGGVVGFLVVERVTPTQIICDNNTRLKVNYDRLCVVGKDNFSISYFSPETPELKEEYQKKVLKSKIDRVINKLDYNKASFTDLCSIYEILSKYE